MPLAASPAATLTDALQTKQAERYRVFFDMFRAHKDVITGVTTWGIAESGAAGPSGNRYGDRAGHACIAIAGPIEKAITLDTFDSGRIGNMRAFAGAALDLLEQALSRS